MRKGFINRVYHLNNYAKIYNRCHGLLKPARDYSDWKYENRNKRDLEINTNLYYIKH